MFKKTSNIITPDVCKVEEWIWVEGYKGTDKDMKCRDHQYEIGKQFDMPVDANIVECHSGFHLCLELNDVFGYYVIGHGNRFFKVRALVRKEDADKYGGYQYGLMGRHKIDKLTSKSIEFIEELTIDEILEGTDAARLPDEYKKMAITEGITAAVRAFTIKEQTRKLIELGYSETFARYVVDNNKFYVAEAVGEQKDLSMDMKVFTIFRS